jgi:formyl-CoA transferase/CoA:oxalate CoA-transferase
MTLPLEGIRVLDMTFWEQGTIASVLLADWGADVVKIEGPDSADPGRGLGRNDEANGVSHYFETNNHNKRGIIIDLKHPIGHETILKMAERADVFIQNLTPGTVERYKLDYETLASRNPRLVYGSANAFGKLGPHHDRRGMANLVQGRGGVMTITGDPSDPPTNTGAPSPDRIGGLLLAFGVLLSLIQREQTGRGQEVNSSLLDGQVFCQGFRLSEFLFWGKLPERRSRKQSWPLWNQFEGADGRWFVMSEPQPARSWAKFCAAIERPDLLDHPALAKMPLEPDLLEGLMDELDAIFAQKPAKEWVEQLRAAGLMAEPVQNYAEVAEDPQVIANEMLLEYEHPLVGPRRLPGLGVHLSDAKPAIRLPAPEFGQHTEEVMLEYGFSWDEIMALRENGAIGPRVAPVSS